MKNTIIFYFITIISCLGCAEQDSPPKVTPDDETVDGYTAKGHFLVGEVQVPLGDGTNASFRLHVQRHTVNPAYDGTGDKFTNEPLVLNDGRTAPKIYEDMKVRWQTFYQDMVDKGMASSEIRRMLGGITGKKAEAGVWVLTGLNIAGYSGYPRKIVCSPNTGIGTIAHESTHGWQWDLVEESNSDVNGILFQDLFTKWANYVYHTRNGNPEMLKGQTGGKNWELTYLNYSLQNDAEWIATTFAGWMYSPDIIDPSWEAIKKNAPEFEMFFNYLWKEGLSVQDSYQQAIGSNNIKHPQYLPTEGVPIVEGFSEEDSEAIWKVCMNAPDKIDYIHHFDSIIRSVAPDLPGSPAASYSLGYGDANHDGITDWIAAYTGPGPVGLGNGRYLWNKENKTGAYTFIVSGKKGDTYAEYKQDPYLTLPSMGGGALAQPWFREWQGEYGSCNGAGLFSSRSESWIKEYLKDIDLENGGVIIK